MTNLKSNDKMPLISVIIPIYNTQMYLEKCINSVISSSYRNLEVILIDDGSTDNSGIICDRFSNEDYRIKVLHKSNSGLSDTRNVGLDLAKGEFLIFIDSDDYIDSYMIEKLYEAIIKHNAEYATCGFSLVDENYNEINRICTMKKNIISGIDALKMHYFSTKYDVNFVSVSGKIFRRELWDSVKFAKGLYFEDIEVMPKILIKCKHVVIENFIGYFYMQRKGSIMHDETKFDKYFKDSINIFKEHEKIYKDANLNSLQNNVIGLLLEKIIISDESNNTSKNIIQCAKKDYKEYYKKLNKKDISFKRYLLFMTYRYFGIKGYKILLFFKK